VARRRWGGAAGGKAGGAGGKAGGAGRDGGTDGKGAAGSVGLDGGGADSAAHIAALKLECEVKIAAMNKATPFSAARLLRALRERLRR